MSDLWYGCLFSCFRGISTFMYSSLLFLTIFLLCHYVSIDWCLKRLEKKIKNMTIIMNQIKHSTWRLCRKYKRIWVSAIWCMFVVYWMCIWDKYKTFLNIFGTLESYEVWAFSEIVKKNNFCFLIMNSFKVCWLNSSIADSLVKIHDVK